MTYHIAYDPHAWRQPQHWSSERVQYLTQFLSQGRWLEVDLVLFPGHAPVVANAGIYEWHAHGTLGPVRRQCASVPRAAISLRAASEPHARPGVHPAGASW